MRKHALLVMTTAAILAYGTLAASAQSPGAQTDTQQSSAIQQNDQVIRDVVPLEDTESLTIEATPGGSAIQQNDQVIRNVEPLQEEGD